MHLSGSMQKVQSSCYERNFQPQNLSSISEPLMSCDSKMIVCYIFCNSHFLWHTSVEVRMGKWRQHRQVQQKTDGCPEVKVPVNRKTPTRCKENSSFPPVLNKLQQSQEKKCFHSQNQLSLFDKCTAGFKEVSNKCGCLIVVNYDKVIKKVKIFSKKIFCFY